MAEIINWNFCPLIFFGLEILTMSQRYLSISIASSSLLLRGYPSIHLEPPESVPPTKLASCRRCLTSTITNKSQPGIYRELSSLSPSYPIPGYYQPFFFGVTLFIPCHKRFLIYLFYLIGADEGGKRQLGEPSRKMVESCEAESDSWVPISLSEKEKKRKLKR